jgi:hypothetical protein
MADRSLRNSAVKFWRGDFRDGQREDLQRGRVLHAGTKRGKNLLAEAAGHEDDVEDVALAGLEGAADLGQDLVGGHGVVEDAVVENEHRLLQDAHLATGVVDVHGVELGAAVLVAHGDGEAVDLFDFVVRRARGLDDGDIALVSHQVEAREDRVSQLFVAVRRHLGDRVQELAPLGIGQVRLDGQAVGAALVKAVLVDVGSPQDKGLDDVAVGALQLAHKLLGADGAVVLAKLVSEARDGLRQDRRRGGAIASLRRRAKTGVAGSLHQDV